jgi:ribosomal protein S18 acetylase RimI-like enzyme
MAKQPRPGQPPVVDLFEEIKKLPRPTDKVSVPILPGATREDVPTVVKPVLPPGASITKDRLGREQLTLPGVEYAPTEDEALMEEQRQEQDELEFTAGEIAKDEEDKEYILSADEDAELDLSIEEALSKSQGVSYNDKSDKAIEALNKDMGKYGIRFVNIGGNVRATATRTGKSIDVDLQQVFTNIFDRKGYFGLAPMGGKEATQAERDEAKKLKDFIKNNATSPMIGASKYEDDKILDKYAKVNGTQGQDVQRFVDEFEERNRKKAFLESIEERNLTGAEQTRLLKKAGYQNVVGDGRDVSRILGELTKEQERSYAAYQDLKDNVLNKADAEKQKLIDEKKALIAKKAKVLTADMNLLKDDFRNRYDMEFSEETLKNMVFNSQAELDEVNKYINRANALAVQGNEIKKLYDDSNTYLNSKHDKNFKQEYVSAYQGMVNVIKNGWNRARASKIVLAAKIDKLNEGITPEDRESYNRRVAELMNKPELPITAIQYDMYKAMQSGNQWELLSLIFNNPLNFISAATTLASESFAQMIYLTGAEGGILTASGALIGGIAGGLQSKSLAGAKAGATAGLRIAGTINATVGNVATNLAMETALGMYGALQEKYTAEDVLNGKWLDDPEIMDKAFRHGLTRGSTIGLTELIGYGVMSRFRVSSIASTPKRLAQTIAMGSGVEIAQEMTGEALAQVVSGEDLNAIEIIAEGLGAVGMVGANPFGFAKEVYEQVRTDYYTDLADNMAASRSFINNTKDNIEDVARWAKNMKQSGKINEDTERKIIDNISDIRQARAAIGAMEDTDAQRQKIMEKGTNSKAENRLADLFAAKRKLERVPDLNKPLQQAIKDEISEISLNKKVPSKGVDISSVVGTGPTYKYRGQYVTGRQLQTLIVNTPDYALDSLEIEIEGDEKMSQLLRGKAEERIDFEYDDMGEQVTFVADTKEQIPVRFRKDAQLNEETGMYEATVDKTELRKPKKDVSASDYAAFQAGNVSEAVLDDIADDITEGRKLTDKKAEIYKANKEGALKRAGDMFSMATVDSGKRLDAAKTKLSRGGVAYAKDKRTGKVYRVDNAADLDRAYRSGMRILTEKPVRKVEGKLKPKKYDKKRVAPVGEQARDRGGRRAGGTIAPLEGAPVVQGATGPDPGIVAVAEKYAQENGIDLRRQAVYVEVDPDFAKRLAAAFENMKHDPSNPKVRAAYDELIKQTKAQYQALVDAGYEFTFYDGDTDPYDGKPWRAVRDLRDNKRMAVYGTYAGYGTEGITDAELENNPMLRETGLVWKDQNGVDRPVTANDLFRAVHDAFGHSMEGAGFRARGEENAWQAHVRLYTGDAVKAMTTETRGQNSWLNFGPYAEQNQKADVLDTVFAENKIGLLPEWAWTENIAPSEEPYQQQPMDTRMKFQQAERQEAVRKWKSAQEISAFKDLATRVAGRIGATVKFINDPNEEYRGYYDPRMHQAVINLAYATSETVFHEILGHPIILAMKSNPEYAQLYENLKNEVLNSPLGQEVLANVREKYNFNNEDDVMEEAIVQLLGMRTDEAFSEKANLKLLSQIKKWLKEMAAWVRDTLRKQGITIEDFPVDATIEDIGKLLGYSNQNIILPGFVQEFKTPTGLVTENYADVQAEMALLAGGIKVERTSKVDEITALETKMATIISSDNNYPNNPEYIKAKKELEKIVDELLTDGKVEVINHFNGMTITTIESRDGKYYIGDVEASASDVYKMVDGSKRIAEYIKHNEEFARNKSIILNWKEANGIVYNPEEAYSRGYVFTSEIGLYSNFDTIALLQNLMDLLDDVDNAGGEIVLSTGLRAAYEPDDADNLMNIGQSLQIIMYPAPDDILWASDVDVMSGTVAESYRINPSLDAVDESFAKAVSGTSLTKYPGDDYLDSIQPNIADCILPKSKVYYSVNEQAVRMNGNNWRIQYRPDAPLELKKLADTINGKLDEKYGPISAPKIARRIPYQVGDVVDIEGQKFEILDSMQVPPSTNIFSRPGGRLSDSETVLGSRRFLLKPLSVTESGIESLRARFVLQNRNYFNRDDFSLSISELELPIRLDTAPVQRADTTEDYRPADDGVFSDSFENTMQQYDTIISEAKIASDISALRSILKKYPRAMVMATSKMVNRFSQDIREKFQIIGGAFNIEEATDEYDEPDYEAYDEVRKIAKERNLGITSDRELSYVARDSKGNVIGGAFTSYDGDVYTFDVVVSEQYEGKGLGSKLLDKVVDVPYYIKEENPNVKIEVDVVNPKMQEMLSKRGFAISRTIGKDRVIMTRDTRIKYSKIGVPSPGTGNTMLEDFREARDLGYPDDAIERMLLSDGYEKDDVEALMESGLPNVITGIKEGETIELPASFANAAGGAFAGTALYNRVRDGAIEAYINRRKDRVKGQAPIGDRIVDHLVATLKADETFKASPKDVQQAMLVDIVKSSDVRLTKNKRAWFNREKIKQKGIEQGKKIDDKLKGKLISYIIINLPKAFYTRNDVKQLLQKVKAAETTNIMAIQEEVLDFVTKTNVSIVKEKINALLERDTTKQKSGREVGAISMAAQEYMDGVEALMMKEGESSGLQIESSIQRINEQLSALLSEYESAPYSQREAMENQMSILYTALMYNSSLLIEDTNDGKLEALEEVLAAMKEVLAEGKADFIAEIKKATEKYNNMKAAFFEDITGGMEIDYTASEKEKQEVMYQLEDIKQGRENVNWLQRIGNLFMSAVKGTEDLDALLDRIALLPSEFFENGIAKSIISGKIFDSRREQARLKKMTTEMIRDAAKKIFGENYKKVMANNAKSTITVTARNGRSVIMSLNEAYYYYNMYKDPANHPSFQTTFGDDYHSTMYQIIERLSETPKILDWADWQVDVMYPILYDEYNAVYRRIYRTDMPWNRFYAGRIYRDGVDMKSPIDIFSPTSPGSQEYFGGTSTKSRKENKNAIKQVDGDYVLFNYLEDMNFFASFGESLRDINKILSDKYIAKAIEAKHSKKDLNNLREMIKRIYSQGLGDSNISEFFGSGMKNFITAKLAFNPKIMLQQLGTFIGYVPFIGYTNWGIYAGKVFFDKIRGINTWKEMVSNSQYLTDRFSDIDIREVLSGVSAGRSKKLGVLPDGTWDKILSMGMIFMRTGDKLGIMGAMPNYLYYKESFMKQGRTEEQAIAFAIQRIEKQTQKVAQSNFEEDKDLHQTGNAFYRAFSIFASQPKQYFRQEVNALRNMYRILANTPGAKGTFRQNLRAFITYHFVAPLMFQWIVSGFPKWASEWDDDDTEDMIWAAILGNINAIFIIGDLFVGVKDVITGKPWAGKIDSLPVLMQIGDVLDTFSSMYNAKKEETRWKNAAKLASQMAEFTGLPAGIFYRYVMNYIEFTKDKDNFGESILRLFGYSDYVVKGANKQKESSSAKLKPARLGGASLKPDKL